MAQNKVVIYTAISGDYEDLHRPLAWAPNVDHVAFVDDPWVGIPWQTDKFEDLSLDQIRRAREVKIRPHRYFPDHDISVWVDGNVVIREDLTEWIELALKTNPLALHRHPENRKSIFEEAMCCVGWMKDDADLLHAQATSYFMDG